MIAMTRAQDWQIANAADYFEWKHEQRGKCHHIRTAVAADTAAIMVIKRSAENELSGHFMICQSMALESVATIISTATFAGIMDIMREFQEWTENLREIA